MSGYFIDNFVTNMDQHFDPYTFGSFAADTGYRVLGGEDISRRYAPLSMGLQADPVPYTTVGDANLNTVFAKIGTSLKPAWWDNTSYTTSAINIEPNDARATIFVRVYHSGRVAISRRNNFNPEAVIIDSFAHLPANFAGGSLEVRCIQTGGDIISIPFYFNSLTNWVTLDGTTASAGFVEYTALNNNSFDIVAHSGLFTLEFRYKTKPTAITSGEFVVNVSANVSSGGGTGGDDGEEEI